MVPVIQLRRLGGACFALNPDLIERAEATPDTVVTLVGGNKYVILESLSELTELIRTHRASILASAEVMGLEADLRTSVANATGNGGGHLRDVSSTGTERDTEVVPIRPKVL